MPFEISNTEKVKYRVLHYIFMSSIYQQINIKFDMQLGHYVLLIWTKGKDTYYYTPLVGGYNGIPLSFDHSVRPKFVAKISAPTEPIGFKFGMQLHINELYCVSNSGCSDINFLLNETLNFSPYAMQVTLSVAKICFYWTDWFQIWYAAS